MLVRQTALALALACLAIPVAVADSGDVWVGGELGFETHAVQSNKTRAQVKQEFLAFRDNPVTADGGRFVGGEVGYVPPQHTYAFQNGRLVHTDKIARNSVKPSLTMSAEEEKLYQQLYSK